MENFTPVSGLIGGLLIGGAASLYVLLNGRVLGISGILGGALGDLLGGPPGAAGRDLPWRVALLAGIVLGPLGFAAAGGAVPGLTAPLSFPAGLPALVAGGLLVGFGTRLGNGCTSGHGVCGLSRGSPRSLAATATFFVVAALTVFLVRHVVAPVGAGG